MLPILKFPSVVTRYAPITLTRSFTIRARGLSLLWGEAIDDSGTRVAARMRTPEGYALTATTAVAIAQRVLAGDAPNGFQTPSLAYGADFIMQFDRVERENVE